jgi:cytoskeletal protein CcmA (bactofilin family)
MSADVLFGSSLSIEGTVTSREDLYFDGQVEGSIEAARSTVTVGPNASLDTVIRAKRVIIAGAMTGSIVASESVELLATSNLAGNITAARILIQDGAYFKGSIEITSPSESAALEDRYARLVDLKYLRSLTRAETVEFESLAAQLASLDAPFYQPLLDKIVQRNDAPLPVL